MTDSDEPTPHDVESAYPLWQTWTGVDQLRYARRIEGAALTAKGEDWLHLIDEIRRAEGMLEDTPAVWR